jgi:hypothetical protein
LAKLAAKKALAFNKSIPDQNYRLTVNSPVVRLFVRSKFYNFGSKHII